MGEDDGLEEYFEPSGGRTEIPPLKVINETRYLEEDLGTLLLEIYERDKPTIEDLASDKRTPISKIKQQVGELRKQGYISVDHQNGEKHYFVSAHWGTQEFPSGPIIPLVYQFNLLSDSNRMDALKTAIDDVVSEGDIVADLGAGVGVLSHLVADRAETVYAVEMDREVYEKGAEITDRIGYNNINYIRADAREIDLPESVDVVLCELIDTALVAELQVEVVNHAVTDLLATGGRVVPHRARTSMQLTQIDFDFFGTEYRLPHFEAYGSRESEIRSEPEVYHEVSFDQTNAEFVDAQVSLKAEEPGIVNGIQLNTDVRFTSDMDWTESSPWFNPPLNLPFDQDLQLQEGDELSIEINYELGGGLSQIAYDIIGGPG